MTGDSSMRARQLSIDSDRQSETDIQQDLIKNLDIQWDLINIWINNDLRSYNKFGYCTKKCLTGGI
jgi:hypothetical protein